jgi:hypothetical protein
MRARVPYLAGLVSESPPRGASLRPARRLFAPDLPLAPGASLEAAAGLTGDVSAADALTGAGMATGTFARDASSLTTTAGAVGAGADGARLPEVGRSSSDPGGLSHGQTPWGLPGIRALPPRLADGNAPEATSADARSAGFPLEYAKPTGSLTPRMSPGASPGGPSGRPFSVGSTQPRATRGGSELPPDGGAGNEHMSAGALSHPAADGSKRASTGREAGRDTPSNGGEPAESGGAASGSLPTIPGAGVPSSGAGLPGTLDPHPGLTLAPDPRAGLPVSSRGLAQRTLSGQDTPSDHLIPSPGSDQLSPLPGSDGRGHGWMFASDLFPGAGSEHRAAPARVSIGTIEVTVLPPPAPAPVAPASPAGLAAPHRSQPAAAGGSAPVADQLRLGARRWYGMAQT